MLVLDFHPVLLDQFAEPSLREMVYKYYAAHLDEVQAVAYAREYLRQMAMQISKEK